MLLCPQCHNLSFTRYLCSREHSWLPEHLRTQALDEKRPPVCVYQQTPVKVAAHHEIKRDQSWDAAPTGPNANLNTGNSCSPSRGCLHKHFYWLSVQGWTCAHPTERRAWQFSCRRKSLCSMRPAQRIQPQHLRKLPQKHLAKNRITNYIDTDLMKAQLSNGQGLHSFQNSLALFLEAAYGKVDDEELSQRQ